MPGRKPVRTVLALGPESWGGFGGIAQGTRDYLGALLSAEPVEHLLLLARHEPDGGPEAPAAVEGRVRGGSSAGFVLEGVRAARALQPDLIVCLHVNLMPVATLARAITGAPVWLFLHGIDAWEPGPPLRRRSVCAADFVTTSSAFTRERFLRWARVPHDRVEVLHNVIDRDAFRPGPRPDALIDRHGLAGRDVLLTLGCLRGGDRRKGHDEILDVLPLLLERCPHLSWLVVGDGPDRPRLAARVARAGLEDHVVWTGRVPNEERADYYRAADGFALLSRSEGFGIVYLEAAACGLPVLGSGVDGSRDALADGRLGRLVDPSDPRALVNELERLLRTPRHVPAALDEFDAHRLPERVAGVLDRHLGAAREVA